MTNDSGKWKPFNLDGSFHFCSEQQTGTNKVAKEKELTVEERLLRLERIILDPRK
jgi:hypothetical protein